MYSQQYYQPAATPYLAPVPPSTQPATAAPPPGQYSPMGQPMPVPQYGPEAYQQTSTPIQAYSQPYMASTPNNYRAATAAQMGLAQINQNQQNQINAERAQDKQRIADLTKAIQFLVYERELAQNAIEKIAPFMMSSIVLGELSVGQDALIEKLSTFLMTSTLLGQMSAGQDALIQMLCGLLQDPYFLAGHYLDLERRLGELPSVTGGNGYQQTQLQPEMPPRPQMPPMPPPAGGAAGFARDTLRRLWESDPSMAWKYVNQINPVEWQRQPLFQ